MLVVDDHAAIRDTTARFLTSKGCSVETASDGRDAVTRFFANVVGKAPFDLILLDLHMPDGVSGGMAMIDLLEARPRPKILVCSGDRDNRLLQNPTYFGFDGVITKPFTFEDLWAEVQRVLQAKPVG